VLLSKLAPAEVLGWYGAAKTIMGTLVAPALILATAAYPHLARTAANNGPLNVEIRAALRPVLLAGALAAVGTYLFADDAISIIYGRQHFAASVIILKVFAPGFLLLFVNVLLGNSLLAAGRAKIFALVKMANVVTCVALELVLIPFFQHSAGNGGIGVVAAVALSELVVFAGAILLLRRDGAGLDIAADVARALGAAALTVGLFALLPRLPFVIGVPLCLIVYLLCTAALGLVRRSDIEKVRAILHNQ
jgi:O-antigen/teichoic acid export membrane protein